VPQAAQWHSCKPAGTGNVAQLNEADWLYDEFRQERELSEFAAFCRIRKWGNYEASSSIALGGLRTIRAPKIKVWRNHVATKL
jgi:hypothetical protein